MQCPFFINFIKNNKQYDSQLTIFALLDHYKK